MKKLFILIGIITVVGLVAGQTAEIKKQLTIGPEAYDYEYELDPSKVKVQFQHEGIDIQELSSGYNVNLKNPSITFAEMAELHLQGLLALSVAPEEHSFKSSIDGILHFILNAPADRDSKHYIINGLINHQISELVNQQALVDGNIDPKNIKQHILKGFTSIIPFKSTQIQFKNTAILEYKNDEAIKLYDIDLADAQIKLIESSPESKKIALKFDYSGIEYKKNIFPLGFKFLNDQIKEKINFTEKVSRSGELRLEFPRLTDVEAALKKIRDSNEFPEFTFNASTKTFSQLYKSSDTFSIAFNRIGNNACTYEIKLDGNFNFTASGQKEFKDGILLVIANTFLHFLEERKDPQETNFTATTKSKESIEANNGINEIGTILKKLVSSPDYLTLIGESPEFLNYGLELFVRDSKDLSSNDASIKLNNFYIKTPETELKINFSLDDANSTTKNKIGVVEIQNPKEILRTWISFYNRLRNILNPILAASNDPSIIKNLPAISQEAEKDFEKLLREFSDKPEATDDITITIAFNKDATSKDNAIKIGTKTNMYLLIALMGFYSKHFAQ